MAWSKTYTFSPSTTISSSQVNQNFDDCINAVNQAMPSGFIGIWSGSIASIPSGFYLCNGSNSTPDLRDKFVVGAGSTYAVGATGGATTHTHTYSGNTGALVLTGVTSASYDTASNQQDHYHSYSGTTASSSSLPPYYALAYIMKS